MRKLILGFVGQMASGKGTATEYLKNKYQADTYRFSTMLRDILNRLYLQVERGNLQKLSTMLRESFGENVMSLTVLNDLKNTKNNLVVIDGIRRLQDIENLKDLPGFVLVRIFADIEKRYERLTQRRENLDDANKTFEDFKKDHEKEAEQEIGRVEVTAKEVIDNNGNMEDLYRQLDYLVEKYKKNE